jgi:phenylalanyl-tRNA synthetase beta chain
MKISLNKLRFAGEHYDMPNLVPAGLDALVEKIGAQLGAVEEVIPYGERFADVIIVKVVSCDKHPNADKLSVCRIDDGGAVKDVKRDSDGLVQVVCGAPNVHAGMLAAWLPPGVTVPSTKDKEPFVLEARELRGVVSNGMLASPKELGLGDIHEGLLEVDVDAKPGTTFTKAYRTEGEAVIEIENKMFTHRPDCFGTLGVAREAAGIQGLPFKSPDWYCLDPKFPAVEAEELKLKVTNELPKLVPRFTAITLRDVKVGPSPVWLQIVLIEVGIKPINNIVDYTNFWMLETGQPLHAYDYDKVKALSGGEAEIVVRQPKKGEKLKLLNGKEIEPRAEAIMIATDKRLIGIGGVMGGTETEVDVRTKNIILECANFDMYSIRRTSMSHGLFTDAVTRFTKGQSPLQNPAVLAIIVEEICRYAGGKVAGRFIDNNHVDKTVLARGSVYPPVTTTVDFINSRLGLKLSTAQIKKLLENVEFTVADKGNSLTVTAPFWRTDIEIPEDMVEEVGRLYGYDKLPLKLPKRDLTSAARDPLLDLKTEVRQRLSKAGANEVLTYSFVHGNLLDKAGQDRTKAFEIANALSPDLQYYRISLMPSLLEKVHPNVKAGYDEFALFELGKGHSLDDVGKDGLPKEFEFTALVVTANDKLKKPGAAYYQAREYLEALTGAELTFKPVGKDMQQYPVVKPYDMNRSALVSIKGGDFLGIIGEFRPSVARALKLPKFTAGFEIDTTVLEQLPKSGSGYVPLFKFPGVKQDITLKVSVGLAYEELYGFIDKELAIQAPDNTNIRLEPIDIYQKAGDTKHKQITFRVTITDPRRTLTDKEVASVLDAVAASVKTKFKAERV